ncbi:MAG: DNA-binding protein [Candidatus Moranbacteria bacterium]|nr:DNA-binding protein [Candidatus Moranbacteria bacterium]
MEQLKIIDERLANIEAMLLSTKTVLTFDEAAIYTGISKSYLYKLTSTGGIPCYKPNGKVLYFNKPELDNWMLQNRKATTDELETKANTYLAVRGGGK